MTKQYTQLVQKEHDRIFLSKNQKNSIIRMLNNRGNKNELLNETDAKNMAFSLGRLTTWQQFAGKTVGSAVALAQTPVTKTIFAPTPPPAPVVAAAPVVAPVVAQQQKPAVTPAGNTVIHDSINLKTVGTGVLEIGKTALDISATALEAIMSGGALAIGRAEAAGLLLAAAGGSLDDGFKDATNGLANIFNAFRGYAPKEYASNGPYRELLQQTIGNTQTLDAIQMAAEVSRFTVVELPDLYKKILFASHLLTNALAAGVGSATAVYILKKTSEFMYGVGDNMLKLLLDNDMAELLEKSLLK